MTADLSKEALDVLQDAARRADGSEVLPRVMLGRFRADDLIKRMGEVITTLCTENDKWFEACGANHVSAMKEAQRADQAEARVTAAEAALAAAMAGAVRVRPGVAERAVWSAMVWAAENSAGWQDAQEYTDGGNSFAEDEARKTVRRIRAALEPNPAAQDREALVAAMLADIAQRADDAADQFERQGNAHAALALRLQATGIRSLATPAQTDALAAVRREARAEGMRKAARIAREACLVPPDGGSPSEEERLVCEAAERYILAAAEKEERL